MTPNQFILYGSKAREDFKKESDIDIAVKGNINEDDKIKILNDIDMLDIPYILDIVFYNELEKEEFIHSIDEGELSMNRFQERLLDYSDTVDRLKEALEEKKSEIVIDGFLEILYLIYMMNLLLEISIKK